MVESLFHGAVRTLGVRGNAEVYERLEAAYWGRAYHDLRHVEAVLGTFLTIEEDLAPLDEVRAILALAYHDAVYDPKASDNEARSAAFMRAELAPLGVEGTDLAEIERLILATKDHAATDPLAALVIDADLAILAAPPDEYDAYAAAIRQEYVHVPDEAYRIGRTEVLESLLKKERLFASTLLDEAAARENMRRELGRLGG